MKKKYYIVLKLLKEIEVKDIFGKNRLVQISNLEGVVPVYETLEQALKSAENGKYNIYAVEKLEKK